MQSLIDLQAEIARAIVSADFTSLPEALAGRGHPLPRLRIHQRHYETSLTAALAGKFPATAWLMGEDLLAMAAREFVHAHPPSRPCIAEYGVEFPEFIANYVHGSVPYLRSFAELERCISEVAIAIEAPPLQWTEISSTSLDCLLQSGLTMQPGIRYVRSQWPVDELMSVHLAAEAPDEFVLSATSIRLEIRGARGEFGMMRLSPAVFIFRNALHRGGSIAYAADCALECDETFDAGVALRELVAAGSVVRLCPASPGGSV
jgi:hypothetical protein